MANNSFCARMALFILAFSATAANAETLPVSWVYPARSDNAAALNSIAIENFGGIDGASLAIRTEDLLRSVSIDGEPYFRILPGGANADAVLRGAASADSWKERVTQKRNICVRSEKGGKCLERKDEEIDCTRRIVRLDYRVRLISTETGGVLFAEDGQPEESLVYCPQDKDVRTVEDHVRSLGDNIALSLRNALAPVERSEGVRVMESRKGLSKADGAVFKDAVRLTKTDASAACAKWAELLRTNPDHLSTAYNVALCAESDSDLGNATIAYQRALALDPGSDYAIIGAQRIEDRLRADRQLAAHFGD